MRSVLLVFVVSAAMAMGVAAPDYLAGIEVVNHNYGAGQNSAVPYLWAGFATPRALYGGIGAIAEGAVPTYEKPTGWSIGAHGQVGLSNPVALNTWLMLAGGPYFRFDGSMVTAGVSLWLKLDSLSIAAAGWSYYIGAQYVVLETFLFGIKFHVPPQILYDLPFLGAQVTLSVGCKL